MEEAKRPVPGVYVQPWRPYDVNHPAFCSRYCHYAAAADAAVAGASAAAAASTAAAIAAAVIVDIVVRCVGVAVAVVGVDAVFATDCELSGC